MAVRLRRFNGIPRRVLEAYLQEVSGERPAGAPDGGLAGDRWTAALRDLPPHEVGALRLNAVELELRGDADTLDAVEQALNVRVRRGGG